MLRRLLMLCVLTGFACQSVYGLGLGELELRSALNQSFEAEIPLTAVRGLEVDEILPGLASQADFDRLGIERNYLLTDLRFRVITKENGMLAVRVTSSRPIVEPFLNFLVEVLWPTGRILREYTVLLDPPVFGKGGVEKVAPAAVASPAPTPATRRQEPAARTTPAPATPTRRLEEGTSAGGEYGMTGPGDTLWTIAAKVRPNNSVSVQQMMLALQRANPDAFISNNINLLKAGHVLRIPSAAEINEETFASAVRAVREQNRDFEAYRGGQVAQLDATRRGGDTTSSGRGSSADGELRLLASDAGRTGPTSSGQAGAGEDSARTEALQNELAVAREDLDRARRASSEMNVRLDDLQDQIETLNEIVKLKDDQLAALRAEVQRMQAAAAAAPAAETAPAAPAGGSLLGNPLVLGALALLLVGGAAGGMIFMRRRKQQESESSDDFSTMAEAQPAYTEPEPDETPLPAVQIEEEEEELSPQTTDVISEAEIYIAYGRFPQAITFLQNAIEAEPDRADLQLKLLEVFVQTEDATAFNLQYEQLKLLGDSDANATAAELQRKIPGAAESAAAAMDATIVSSEPITAIDEPELDDDDLSFDLDDLDAETDDDTLDISEDVNIDDDAEELDIDLELDETASEDALAGDMDLSLAADSSDEELDLDLDLDLDDDSVTSLDDESLDADADDLEAALEQAAESERTLDGNELELDLDDELSATAELETVGTDGDSELALDDDAFSLDLDTDDDALELDLDSDDDALELDLDSDDDALELDLDSDDDALELDLETASDTLDLGDEAGLDLDDDGAIELDLDDDVELDLDDDLELNLDEDASTKLDLARAYIDMGDSDGARSVLQEVLKEGSDTEIQEANELLEKID
ncbi:MAG: FimV/HubP family polar landmark protein [Pseudomonadota bacterium]